ncbi:minor capsid protein [Streptococcus phage Javan174]|uniref:minor capsid protein n=1 Tax=Streptococcus entericus TaxID=155680 RepID=UPI00036ADA78|nr:minor capsid protein [Streptococcus entericus]QBX24112.1 minor capsid protein [Streptococcus phage Javan174]
MAKGFVTHAHVDLGGVTKKVSPGAVRRGRQAMANQILLDTTHYVPFLGEGIPTLRASATIGLQGETVNWNTVYARAQFYGTNGIVIFREYTTPGTGKNWYVKAKNKHLDQWKDTAVEAMGLK